MSPTLAPSRLVLLKREVRALEGSRREIWAEWRSKRGVLEWVGNFLGGGKVMIGRFTSFMSACNTHKEAVTIV